MRINQHVTVVGNDVLLVPYRKEHVPKYHTWMQSQELQQLTASEPLTLDEEYRMQKSWMEDDDKCTFIILDKATYDQTNNEIESMIGDTNLYFTNSEDRMVAEAEIMIAEQSARGQHKGWQAMLLMLMYGITYLDVKQYVVKISFNNAVSINMFKKMCFVETERSQVFQEVTMNKIVDDEWKSWIKSNVGNLQVCTG